MVPSSFARQLEELRKKKLLTREDLAERANIPTDTIKSYESGRRRPSMRNAKLLAEALGLHPDTEEYTAFVQQARGDASTTEPALASKQSEEDATSVENATIPSSNPPLLIDFRPQYPQSLLRKKTLLFVVGILVVAVISMGILRTATSSSTSSSNLCAARVALYSWYSPSREDYFITGLPDWTGKPGAIMPPDYHFVRFEGWICDPDAPQPLGTIPLYNWWSPSRGDNFATTHSAWAGIPGSTELPDYEFGRIEGYIYSPDGPQPTGTLPLYGWWSGTREDNIATTDPEWVGKPGDNKVPSYNFSRVEGYTIE